MMSNETARVAPQRLAGDDGANLVEYAMLMALIVLVALSAVRFFGNRASAKFDCASSAISNEVTATC